MENPRVFNRQTWIVANTVGVALGIFAGLLIGGDGFDPLGIAWYGLWLLVGLLVGLGQYWVILSYNHNLKFWIPTYLFSSLTGAFGGTWFTFFTTFALWTATNESTVGLANFLVLIYNCVVGGGISGAFIGFLIGRLHSWFLTGQGYEPSGWLRANVLAWAIAGIFFGIGVLILFATGSIPKVGGFIILILCGATGGAISGQITFTPLLHVLHSYPVSIPADASR